MRNQTLRKRGTAGDWMVLIILVAVLLAASTLAALALFWGGLLFFALVGANATFPFWFHMAVAALMGITAFFSTLLAGGNIVAAFWRDY